MITIKLDKATQEAQDDLVANVIATLTNEKTFIKKVNWNDGDGDTASITFEYITADEIIRTKEE